jgi:hypothetical protein
MPKGHKDTFKTISQIVDGVCLDLGEGSHRKEQYYHWAIKHIERWNMDQAREVKTVELKLTPWKAIELPKDCIDWIAIGIQAGNVIKTFVHNRDIALLHQKDAAGVKMYNDNPKDSDYDIEASDVYTEYQWPFYNFTSYGEDPGRLFGLMVKDSGLGYFTENRNQDSCEIQFKTKIKAGTKIYVEYLSNGFCPCKETLVHPYACELIALGIHHERLKFDKSAPRSVVYEAKQEYEEEFRRVVDRMWDYSIEDIIEDIRGSYKLTPKR